MVASNANVARKIVFADPWVLSSESANKKKNMQNVSLTCIPSKPTHTRTASSWKV